MKGVIALVLAGLAWSSVTTLLHKRVPTRAELNLYEAKSAKRLSGPGVVGVLDIISGFLYSVGSQTNETDIVSCLTNLDAVDTDVTDSVTEIKEWTWDSVESGIEDLASALEVIPLAMNTCKGSVTEDEQLVEGLLGKFEHPVTFFFQAEEHLMIDGIDILSNIKGALNDWNSSNYFGFGSDIGTAMVLVVDGYKNKAVNPVVVDVVQVIGGLLQGIADGIAIQNIETCIGDTETIGDELYAAVELLKNATDPTDAKGAIHDFGVALEFLPGAITSCQSAVQNDAADIAQMISNFESPLTFLYVVGKNLVINGADIYDEMSTAVTDWDVQNWYGFGENLGEALAATFL